MYRTSDKLEKEEIVEQGEIHLEPVKGPTLEQLDKALKELWPVKNLHCSKLLQDPMEKIPHRNLFSERKCGPAWKQRWSNSI